MSKELVFMYAQRHAFDTMASPTLKDGSANNFYVRPSQITMPSFLIQEQPLLASTPVMTFEFGINAPQKSDTLNNIILGQNDIASIYGLQLLIGYGATRVLRQYQAYGASIDDDAVYKSKLSMKFETNTLITDLETNNFRCENGTTQLQYDGADVVNPQRQFSGRVSSVNIILDLGNVAANIFTANTFVSMRMLICKGAAAAVK
jgi:hypothetical protein